MGYAPLLQGHSAPESRDDCTLAAALIWKMAIRSSPAGVEWHRLGWESHGIIPVGRRDRRFLRIRGTQRSTGLRKSGAREGPAWVGSPKSNPRSWSTSKRMKCLLPCRHSCQRPRGKSAALASLPGCRLLSERLPCSYALGGTGSDISLGAGGRKCSRQGSELEGVLRTGRLESGWAPGEASGNGRRK